MALPYARFMLRRAARRAARVLTVSQATAADLTARLGVPAERIVTIWNGVDERFRAPLDEAARDARLAGLGLSPGYFLFVGNPKPHKNLDRLLAAFAGVATPGARLVVVGGESPGAGALRDPRVVAVGRVDAELLPALYRGALALVFPSLYEGFGLPVAEAMACGTPVVASTTPAVAEVGGDAALLVDPLDVAAWTAALQRLAAEPQLRARLSEAGRRRSESFSWSDCARRTLAVYREVLAGSPPR
jgi:glycosyltransferase involved in cell wall biosynthesis